MTLAMASVASADLFLAVDKPTTYTPTTVQVEINGVVTDGLCTFGTDAIGDFVKILNVTTFTPDSYIFKARWHDGSGFWCEWSDPFVAGRTGAPSSARIIEE